MERRKLSSDELKEILRLHRLWLNGEDGGKRADLSNADLRNADLRYAVMRYAVMSNADMSNADMSNADMSNADMSNADLRYAVMRYADLRYAVMSNAVMSNADMRNADLRYAVMRYAVMSNAVMRYAVMSNADMRYAVMSNAVSNAAPLACPECGSFIGWKKAHNKIVKLQITDDAKRSSATGRKCRCSKAIVVAIENKDGTESDLTSVGSTYDSNFIYTVGETVEVPDFCEDRWQECAPGIHFFVTRQEAVDY